MLGLFAAPTGLAPGIRMRAPIANARSAADIMMADSIKLTEQQMKAFGGPEDRPLTKVATDAAPVAAAPAVSTATGLEKLAEAKAALVSMIGAGPETGTPEGEAWDPLGLASNAEDLAWYRAAELKHGRVCMAALLGYVVTAQGIFLPGEIAPGIAFSDLGTDPFAAWAAVPEEGKWQIVFACGAIEWQHEQKQPHYTMGGAPGEVPFWREGLAAPNYNSYLTRSPEEQLKTQVAELKNGRLAMIAVASLYANHVIPGAVPGLTLLGSLPGYAVA